MPGEEAIILPEAPQPQGPGDLQSVEVAMGENYHTTVYLNLETGQQHSIAYDAYDLAFANTPAGPRVYLTRGKLARACPTPHTDLTQVIGVRDFTPLPDVPSLHDDSLGVALSALAQTVEGWSAVYVLDRGSIVHREESDRFRKFQVKMGSDGQWAIRIGRLAQTADFTELSFAAPAVGASWMYVDVAAAPRLVEIEPNWEWHLLFTQYMHDYGPSSPDPSFRYYSVTGTLLNTQTGMQAMRLNPTELPFDSLRTLAQLPQLTPWTPRPDVIGFDWKRFDFDKGFVTETNRYYALRLPNGAVYKLRFTDFFNSQGQKGHPNFDYQRLGVAE
jgi:hypothetical protein